MTEPTVASAPPRRSVWLTTGYFAVVLILAGVAYVVWDLEQGASQAKAQRNALQTQVDRFGQQIAALKTDLAKKDAEIRRLTRLLVQHGIDPRPSASPAAAGTRSPTAVTPSSYRSQPPATTAPQPAPAPTRSPAASPTSSPSPSPVVRICIRGLPCIPSSLA